ncbi:MAG: LysM peptidoglycan-binding domain-containing protein [Kiritimatiellae bacterium]|nr:LysM peptidoglycan-binding domain-containing protein [Kiritimatiellia bacterium]
MKTPVLVFIVAMLHVAAVGTLVMVQGCGTTQPSIEPEIAPVLPPGPVPGEEGGVPSLAPARPERPAMTPPVEHVPEIGSYTVQNGESLSRIAHRNKVSVRELMELNAIKDANRIRVGQTLLIPGYKGVAVPPKPPKSAPKTPAVAPEPSAPLTPGGEYTVQNGDILGRIAQRHGVKVRDLKAINKLTSDNIRVGQKLVIPAGGKTVAEAPATSPEPAPEPAPVTEPAMPTPPPPPLPTGESQIAPVPTPPVTSPVATPVPPTPPAGSSSNVEYPVVQGETVESIARAFLVTPEAIRGANNIPAGGQPAVGSVIIIPIPE